MRPPDRVPSLTILFHSDLRRVGDRTRRHLFDSGPVTLGRQVPLFGKRPLDDPCISRSQLEIEWDGDYFRVRGTEESKREVRAFDIDGHTLNPDRIPPRCLLAIEKRLVLWLDSTRRSRNDMGLIGHSSRMFALRKHIRRAGKLGDSVFIRGEDGVEKGRVAEELHRVSRYRSGPMVTVTCGSLPRSLASDQLFGPSGLVQSAAGGCLYLDGVADLTLPVQEQLLGVLSEREVDFLLVTTTHRNLPDEVQAGRFSEELYARIRLPAVSIPPLRDRPEDTPLLFAHFLSFHADTLPHLIREATQRGIRRAEDVTQYEIQGALDASDGPVGRAAMLLQISRRDLAHLVASPGSLA